MVDTGILPNKYEVSPLPNVTRHSGWWQYTVTPSINRTLHQFWPLLVWTVLPNLTFYLIVRGLHRTFETGAACQQRTLTPPKTWSCPTLGFACVPMSRPISPELVLFPDFLSFEHPLVLLLCLEDTGYVLEEKIVSWNVNRFTTQGCEVAVVTPTVCVVTLPFWHLS